MFRRRGMLILAAAVVLGNPIVRGPHGSLARAQGVALDNRGSPLPTGAIARMGGLRFRHRDGIATLAYSLDGKRLLSGGANDGTLRLWDAQTGKELRSFR